jgi:hypothetical protein
MKNFPHQFNNLEKLFNALAIVKDMQDNSVVLTDENFGIRLTRAEIYTYRNKELSIDEYLDIEAEKPVSNRGYLTVARDIRRLFQLLEFIYLSEDKNITILTPALQLLSTESEDLRNILWKNNFFNLGLEGIDGEISHPYRILVKLVQDFPGIESTKLLLALEAENDSPEEYERISSLVHSTYDEIVSKIGTTESMARNAVKILPAIAVQVGDIIRSNNRAYPISTEIVTEDEITSIESDIVRPDRAEYREATIENIAVEPNLSHISNSNIDLTSAIRLRQKRLVEHQEIVRKLAVILDSHGYTLYEGKFDCLSTNDEKALLFEVKTLSNSVADEEKQSVKGVGQLKFYNFSIVREKMGLGNIFDFLVFSRKPSELIIRFCKIESISVLWCVDEDFYYLNKNSEGIKYEP